MAKGMSDTKAVQNGIWNLLSTISVVVVGFVGSILIVRDLSTTAYGGFQYYTWLAGILGIFGTFAFPKSLTKIAAELRGKGEHDEAYALAFWVSVGTLCLNLLLGALVFVWAFNRQAPQATYLMIIGATLAFHGLSRVFTSTFWAHERYRSVTIVNTVAVTLQMVLIVASFALDWGVVGFLFAILSYHVTTALLLTVLLLARLVAKPVNFVYLKRATLKRYFLFSVPSTLLIVFQAIVWQRSEIFFLERFSSFAEVGFYGLAFTIFSVFLALGWSLMNGYHPAISKDFGAGNTQGVSVALSQGALLAALFALPLTFGAASALGGAIVPLYGAKMQPAVPVALILFVPLFLAVLAELFAHTVSALDRQWLAVRVGLGVAAFNLTLNLLLIPRYGALGAAVSNALAQITYCLFLFGVVRPLTDVRLPWKDLGSLALISFVTAYLLPELVQQLIPGLGGLFVAIATAVGSYLGLIMRLGYAQKCGLKRLSELMWFADLTGRARDPKRLRILHILGDRQLPRDPEAAGISGVVRVALELAKQQTLQGHDVQVVTVGARAWQTSWQGVTLRTLNESSIKTLPWRWRRFNTRIFLPYLWLTWRQTFDVSHSHLYNYQRFLRAGLKVAHFHTDPLYKGSGGVDVSLKPEAARIIVSSSDVQLAVSAFVARQLSSCLGPEATIRIAPNGVDVARYGAAPTRRGETRKRLGLSQDAPTFLFVGAVVPEKGLLELARAFAELSKERPDVHLLLAGARRLWGNLAIENDKHTGYEQEVRTALADAEGRGKVSYLGTVNTADMPSVYGAADVVVVPSVWKEAFGLVALEAFAAGRAVIASDTGGLGELARRAQQSLVAPGEVKELYQAMLSLSGDAEHRQRLGERALAAAASFGWHVTAKQVETIYTECSARRIDALEKMSI